MKPQTTAPAAIKRRRTIDEKIADLQAKQAQQLLEARARTNADAVLASVKHKCWTDARTILQALDRALAELEKGGA